MPSLAEPPSPSSPPRPPTKARSRPWLSRDPEARAVHIGLAATVLFHLLLIIGLPFLPVPSPQLTSHLMDGRPVQQFDIQLADDPDAADTPPPPPDRFVETNPDAPENIPDETRNFAAQNQQAAQEKPNPLENNDRAATTGQTEIESTALISGQLRDPEFRPAPTPPAPDVPVQETPPPAEEAVRAQNPLPGTERIEGDSPDGIGTTPAPVAPDPSTVPEIVEGLPDATRLLGVTVPQMRIDPSRPAPRPVLAAPKARPAPIFEQKFGTSNLGVAGWDAKWSNYGTYLQRLIDSVQAQFDRIMANSRVRPPVGSSVIVKWVLDSNGEVARIVSVESTAGKQGEQSAVSSITDRAPYGPWTEDMIAMLGKETEFTFTFYFN